MKFLLLLIAGLSINIYASNAPSITEKEFHKKRVVVTNAFNRKRIFFESGMYSVEPPKQEDPKQPERLSEKTSKEDAIV